MTPFLIWLANSPLASALKIGSAAALVWLVDNIGALHLQPAVAIGITAALPVIINWLNPEDPRYGKQ